MTLWTCVVDASGDRKAPGLNVTLCALDRIEQRSTRRRCQQRLGAVAASVVAPERRSPEYLRDFVVSENRKMGRSDQGQWRGS